MIRKGFLLVTLAALVGLPLNTALAERLTQRVPRGNNVGLGINVNWSMPLNAQSWSGNTIQFPKGSGNLITNDAWTFGLMTVRDFSGDGVSDDTIVLGSGGRDNMGGYASSWGHDVITAAAAVQPNMEGHMGEIQYNRVWTSLDAAELEAWPIEAREGFSPSGAPIIHGAETMFTHSGDVYNSWAGPPSGFYMGWSFYFLDFAESNNMVYAHVLLQNVTEYMKYNPGYGYGLNPKIAPYPDGWDWKGMVLFENQRQMQFGSATLGYGYHPAKEILVGWSKSPTIGSFSPPNPPLMGVKMLKKPVLRDQTANMTNIWTPSDTEFGFSGAGNLLASGLPLGRQYRCAMAVENFFGGQINPFTGRVAYGWPGVLQPTDARFNQWIWGGASNWNRYTFWGEIKDVAPRDTMSFDFVIMFSPTGVTPLVAPPYDLANIDNPMMQQAFLPQEQYANVAQTTFEGGYITPATPIAPPLTIIPGDRKITLTWSDINLQTPDPYFAFLQANPELDPNGIYREYDFEGYRLYRSYVGPNDSHSEMIYNCSLSDGNLAFFFVDRLEDDRAYGRLRNGMKVWYALVPYDINYDPATGDAFSLPDPSSGKVWNRPGEAGLFNVIPRSDASNFREADLGSVAWVGASPGGYEDAGSVTLAGDGSGRLVDPPRQLMPSIKDIKIVPINNERITSDRTVSIVVTDQGYWDRGCTGNRQQGTRTLALLEGTKAGVGVDLIGGGSGEQTLVLQNPADADGVNYAVEMTIQHVDMAGAYDRFHYHMDVAGYAGGQIDLPTARWCGPSSRPGTSPTNVAMVKAGRFTIAWKDAGGGNLTIEVRDVVRNVNVPHADYPDQQGWGFQTVAGFGGNIGTAGLRGTYYDEAFVDDVPAAQRTVKMASTLPADNTQHFGLWLNGCLWRISAGGGDGIAMPAVGATWTATNAFGVWNGDRTVFTQVPDLPWEGDKWTVEIKKSSMDAEDADLSKVRVVPNPYIASSFLDLSTTQRRIDFVNLPDRCTIRIYTLGGNLVNVLNHIGSNRSGWGNYTDWDRLTLSEPKVMTGYDNHGGTEPWNLRNRFGQTVASGLYFFHVTDQRGKTHTGKFYIIN